MVSGAICSYCKASVWLRVARPSQSLVYREHRLCCYCNGGLQSGRDRARKVYAAHAGIINGVGTLGRGLYAGIGLMLENG
jgi:hypothetical protein